MKKIINFILLLVLGLVVFPSIASADVKEINGISYSRTNIDYSLEEDIYHYMYGIISPTDFIVYEPTEDSNDGEYHYFKNELYREEKATVEEVMKSRDIMWDNNSSYIEYDYSDEYEIFKTDNSVYRDHSNNYCYKLSTDLTAQDGVTYYTQEMEGINTVFNPVSEFDEDEVLNYFVSTECSSESTGTTLTEAQITILESLIDSIEEENEVTYADKFNLAMRYFPVLFEGKFINVFQTSYTDEDINWEEVNIYPYKNVFTFYDLEGNKLGELEGYTYLSYFSKSNLIAASTAGDATITILDSKFNVLFTEEDPNYERREYIDCYFFDIDDNRLLIDFEEGKAIMITRYVVLDGANQTYEGKDLVIRFNGEVSLFDKVYINDTELSTDNFAISEGSTIITLKDAYLKTLSNATYTLKATYKDGGNASTTFVVNNVVPTPEPNPDTNDTIIGAVMLGSISLMAIACLSIATKKKRYN